MKLQVIFLKPSGRSRGKTPDARRKHDGLAGRRGEEAMFELGVGQRPVGDDGDFGALGAGEMSGWLGGLGGDGFWGWG